MKQTTLFRVVITEVIPYLATVANNNNPSVHVGMRTNGTVLMTQQLQATEHCRWPGFNSRPDIPSTGHNKQGVGVRNVSETPDK